MANHNVTSSGSVVVGDNDVVKIKINGGGNLNVAADPNDDVAKIKIMFIGDGHVDNLTVDLGTFSENNLQIDIHDYDPMDTISLPGAFDFYVDPDNPDEFTFSYYGSDGGVYTGYIKAKDGGEKDFTDPFQPINIICFADGTLIDTPSGPVAVETLRPGDLVLTRDSGPLPLRWVGRRELSARELSEQPELRPLKVARGTYGENRPSRDLVLSPNHRVLLNDWRIEFLFGTREALAAVRFLVNETGIDDAPWRRGVAYNHLLFDRHEIVTANDMPCESLYPGPVALDALDDSALSEIRAIFPEALDESVDIGAPARRILRGFEARALVEALAEPAEGRTSPIEKLSARVA
ncbi:Hint domain-containing protein [Gymnodinialimonas ceratoperidinii]|uniref:Hint domain-containing protein n=1 Tax=Gymnodinialimonas ceratoperidinii TaxID=2856823 RepID=A0A8F6TTE3_9RHOB|nr:Hint domain-containing protein [Gymnodinialimonas ceratoperidinii]QXT38375.1 Hint domain-containing protein [Gymnodinialimonas ceratoperidinii]